MFFVARFGLKFTGRWRGCRFGGAGDGTGSGNGVIGLLFTYFIEGGESRWIVG